MMCIYASPGSATRIEAADDEVHLQHSDFLQGLPSQLSAVTWRTVLGFKALCALYALGACQREVFSTAYALRRTTKGTRYFVPQSGVEKINVNMVNSDHGIRDTMFRVTGQWDVESKYEHGIVLVIWNLDSSPHGGTLSTANVEAKLRKLTTINYNNRNWNWLLDPNRPLEPPVIPRVPALGKN